MAFTMRKIFLLTSVCKRTMQNQTSELLLVYEGFKLVLDLIFARLIIAQYIDMNIKIRLNSASRGSRRGRTWSRQRFQERENLVQAEITGEGELGPGGTSERCLMKNFYPA